MTRRYSRPVTILKHARELLSDRKRWTQGTTCRRLPDNTIAYCSYGAVMALSANDSAEDEACAYLFEAATKSRGWGRTVLDINDDDAQKPHVVHRNVLAMFDRAIKLAAVGGK